MYNFILNQWVMKKFTETNVQNCVTKGYITQDQADTILATPQFNQQ
jgi:hypothetical protein